MRTETEVFDELRQLCKEPGYIHAIAYFCFRDFTVTIGEQLTTDDLLHLFGTNRLIKTELTTLLGMMVQGPNICNFPGPDQMQIMIDQTESLLSELHSSLMTNLRDGRTKNTESDEHGMAWREPIFYGGESAYASQYRELSKVRYSPDEAWLLSNKGFTTDTAVRIIYAIQSIQNSKLQTWYTNAPHQDPNTLTPLSCFTVTLDEIAENSEIDIRQIGSLFDALKIQYGGANPEFNGISDFNEFNARPIIQISEESFVIFMTYSLFESIYESPYFWFINDKAYKPTGEKNRGLFTENFAASRLAEVFGQDHVHTNIEIYKNTTRVGEIDVLVEYAGRLLVLQAKSKKLTIAARKGNAKQLQSDFKAAIQDAYDQGLSCSEFFLSSEYTFTKQDGSKYSPARHITKIHICTVVAEHYPALTFQAREFLKFKTTDIITEPFTMDVFLLDVMCEMLDSPLRFLDYMERRARLYHRIMASHELTVLSYHMTSNLWVDDKTDFIQLADDVSAELENIMLVRRDGVPGNRNSNDSVTTFSGTPWRMVVDSLTHTNNADVLAVGCRLLGLSGQSIGQFNQAVSELLHACEKDGRHHDFIMAFNSDDGFGITIHCNDDSHDTAWSRLESFCIRRKYEQKATRWCGVCISAASGELRFIQHYNSPWRFSKELDHQTKFLKPSTRSGRIGKMKFSTPKPGRNDPCSCGSRKKYKKCCLTN
ncbi:SEC-C metal-binding domain-containing protein [Pseudomonas sp. CFBP 13727]|uniref:SEC-C metal-binding domain-containing protein n=1 Tax=Pseudomonas sp. CFBP 13727 TaxID=2775295 RepID=UPI00177B7FD3|nr:SEC-C metal-binding domain-containing protein [Pseudomonas sp. CFBP 13727]MBD8622764.1 SEC-C domain-containing protein [Pseudomonas sp. CFBP 13727]